MSMTEYDLENEDQSHGDDWKSKAEEALAKARAAEKRAAKAEQALAPYQQRDREKAVDELVGPLGEQAKKVWLRVNPDIEPTEETVGAFAEEFGFTPSTEKKTEPAYELAPLEEVPGGTPKSVEPVSIDSADMWRAAQRGDIVALERMAEAEVRNPGTIKFKHPEALG